MIFENKIKILQYILLITQVLSTQDICVCTGVCSHWFFVWCAVMLLVVVFTFICFCEFEIFQIKENLQSHFNLGNVKFKLVFIFSFDDPAISTNNSLTLKIHNHIISTFHSQDVDFSHEIQSRISPFFLFASRFPEKVLRAFIFYNTNYSNNEIHYNTLYLHFRCNKTIKFW